MKDALTVLRRIHKRAQDVGLRDVDADLSAEAGMDGSYARLLQAARDLETLRVVNAMGRPFNVRIVRQGGGYGADDCLTHDNADPLVEFYDAAADPAKFGPRGQFVSRYFLSTLEGRSVPAGLNLHGGVSVWRVSAANVAAAIAYARSRP